MSVADRIWDMINREEAKRKRRETDLAWKDHGDYGELQDRKNVKWEICPICNKEMESTDTGTFRCEDHGDFEYHCPLCNTLMQVLVLVPSVHMCPNPDCDNNCALYTPVNNHGLQLARRQFLKGFNGTKIEGPNRKKAREILMGTRKKAANGKKIPNFGGIGVKHYFDSRDVDRIFSVWDECYSKEPLPDKDIIKSKPVPERKPIEYVRTATDVPEYVRHEPEAESLPQEEEPEIPDDEPRRFRCPRCSDVLRLELFRYLPTNIDYKGWRGLYRPVGRKNEYYHWAKCQGKCQQPFIIVQSEDNRPSHGDWTPGYPIRPNLRLRHVTGLREPYSYELNQIEKQIAQYDVRSQLNSLKAKARGYAPTSKERNEIMQQIGAVAGKYSADWGKIVGAADINPNSIINFSGSGMREQKFASRRKILNELLEERGVAEDDRHNIIRDIERRSQNDGEFDNLAGKHLGVRWDAARRRYHQTVAESDAQLAEKHDKPVEEKQKYRERAQKLSSADLGFFNRLGKRGGDASSKIVSSIVMLVVGIVIAAFMQDMLFFYGMLTFAFWAIMPGEQKIEYNDDILKSIEKAQRTQTEGGTQFSQIFSSVLPFYMFFRAGRFSGSNRFNIGIATVKVFLRITGIILIGLGLYQSAIPMAAAVYMLFVFAAYYQFPIKYDIDRPDQFIGSLARFLLGLFVPISLYGLFGPGSGILVWISMAFLLVFPVASAKTEATALNMAANAGESQREMLDKLLFIFIMVFIAALFTGILNVGVGIDFEGTSNTVFWASWGIGLFAGLLSPSEVRPYTGMIVIAIVFFLFMTGPGQQAVGSAFLGQWWPVFHNTVTSITEPFGGLFENLQGTFGKTFLLLTNPIGYADQIMEGTYEKNPTGLTGSYGVEIDSEKIPSIYPGTPAMVSFNVKNVGPVEAKDVVVMLEVPEFFKDLVHLVKKDASDPKDYATYVESDDGEYVRYILKVGDAGDERESFDLALNEIMPFFIMINSDCADVNERQPGRDYQYEKRDHYIPLRISISYGYNVTSWLPVEIISDETWKKRTTEGTFNPDVVLSHVSTSPVKLSLGSFDQPIVEGKPLYIGFNMSSAEGKDSKILWDWSENFGSGKTTVTLKVPSEFDNAMSNCQPVNSKPAASSNPTDGTSTWEWTGEDAKGAVFCVDNAGIDIDTPSNTYYIYGESDFRFKRWVEYETLFAFSDVCEDFDAEMQA